MRRPDKKSVLLLAASLMLSWVVFAQSDRVARFPAMSRAAEEKGLAEPFKGITTPSAQSNVARPSSRSTMWNGASG